ncbi:MAG: hypothetical protein A4E45_01022 [Methanosaeta sp. PtaB.Bin039]|nr:MAG: hypothetical protein A4E45_01022 [Methanosaeta sp. PtaB.Bin039]
MTDRNTPGRPQPRDSDNPIIEQFKDDLLYHSFAGWKGQTTAAEKQTHLESLLGQMMQRVKNLEARVEKLEEKG